MLSSIELEHYTRQMQLPEVGVQGQQRLKQARVLVVGIGGLGCPLVTYLAMAGCGYITLVDGDCIESSNLNRQPLYGVDDIGQYKVDVALKKLQKINPLIEIQCRRQFVNSNTLPSLIETHDLILDCTDSLSMSFLMHDVCYQRRKDFITSKIHRWDGYITTLLFSRITQGCLHCLWDKVPADGLVKNCNEEGVLGVVPGLFGLLMAQTALMHLLQIDNMRTHNNLLFDSRLLQSTRLTWPANPDCTLCGTSQTPDVGRSVWADQLPNNPIFVDVREGVEAQQTPFIASSGEIVLHKPLSQQTQWESEIKQQNRPVVFVCATGIRSMNVIQQSPFHTAKFYSLKGGLRCYF